VNAPPSKMLTIRHPHIWAYPFSDSLTMKMALQYVCETHDMPEITYYGQKFYRFWEHEIKHYQKLDSFESTYCVIKQ
jgi:hypothetical protein